jgi:DNA-binding transcriptional LysR family regulator
VSRPDLNLLVALDALLAAGSVAAAARRLRLSPSAMSRTLARLRATTGDPLLVRAGRRLVATPRAAELRDRVGQVVHDAEAVLRPASEIDVAAIDRAFTVRTSEGFVENFGPGLIRRLAAEAPRVRLRFVQKLTRDSEMLREGSVDLETGVIGKMTSPEIHTQLLFRDRFIGVVRAGHPLARGRISAARYAKAQHVEVAQHVNPRNLEPGPIDGALRTRGLERDVAVIVDGFSTAVALARASDLIASVPERHTASARAGMTTFALPFPVREITVSLLWHPRLDADPAHRWLRRCIREVAHARQGQAT